MTSFAKEVYMVFSCHMILIKWFFLITIKSLCAAPSRHRREDKGSFIKDWQCTKALCNKKNLSNQVYMLLFDSMAGQVLADRIQCMRRKFRISEDD